MYMKTTERAQQRYVGLATIHTNIISGRRHIKALLPYLPVFTAKFANGFMATGPHLSVEPALVVLSRPLQ